VQELIRRELEQAEAKVGKSDQWRLAKFALVCWIDEVLSAANWRGRFWWINNALERFYFDTRDRSVEYYRWATQASTHTQRDALEVYYLGVVLGFRGLYDDPLKAAIQAPSEGLPTELQSWLEQTWLGIRMRGVPPLQSTGRLGPGAPARRGQSRMFLALAAASALGAIVVGLLLVIIYSGNLPR
jgi:type VI secretion system protein ImpK